MQKVTKYYLKPISPTEAQDLRGNVFHHPQCKEWKAKFAIAHKLNRTIVVIMEGSIVTKMHLTLKVNPDVLIAPALPNDFIKNNEVASNVPEAQLEIMNFIKDSAKLKPALLKMTELKWKFLIRSAMRGKNIMMTGPSGCGKTMASKSLVRALKRPDFYFNLGATQDPRSTLIGNTHFNKQDGTFFSEALFVKAIQTENAVILLDELSRAHPDAHNILMTVLDEGQRYLRLDEAKGSPTIKVAKGVTFIATANIGNEYTATRVMDRALVDRFITVEMDTLNKEQEIELLNELYPNVENELVESVADIVSSTRIELGTEDPRISTHISTRNSVEMVSLLYDGFNIEEAAEVCIYPQYDQSGGLDSERTFVKQLVQKHIKIEGISDDLIANEQGEYTTADGSVSS
jgi:nitric oxide reductase NorQ protein